MAFVLVATMIFFAIVFLFYAVVRFSALESSVEDVRETEVLEIIRKMASTAEFSWTHEDCESCIDMDKALMLKNRTAYEGFWKNVPLLKLERVHPEYSEQECTKQTYPDCNTITLVEEKEDSNWVAHKAFVSLCRYEASEKYYKCELGKIVMGYEAIE